jgi:hypothetical protein
MLAPSSLIGASGKTGTSGRHGPRCFQPRFENNAQRDGGHDPAELAFDLDGRAHTDALDKPPCSNPNTITNISQ